MTIEQRLNRLERQNRRLRLGGMVLLLGIGAVFLMGQANGEPGNLIVRSLKVVDDGGKVRLLLQGTGNQLTTWDQNGGPRVRLWGGVEMGSRVELNDTFGFNKIRLSVMKVALRGNMARPRRVSRCPTTRARVAPVSVF